MPRRPKSHISSRALIPSVSIDVMASADQSSQSSSFVGSSTGCGLSAGGARVPAAAR